jgi:Asp-tRNA(Asn)/Glu-tRNA(Gln) amidotransferase C subunit
MSEEFRSISELKKLLASNCKVEAVASTIKTMLSKESVNRQEEVWNIVTEQVRNNYVAVGNSAPVRIDNECICVTAKRS